MRSATRHWHGAAGVTIFLILLIMIVLAANAATNVGCNADATIRANDLIAAVGTAVTAGGTQIINLAASCTYTLTVVNNGGGTINANGLPRIATGVNLTMNGNSATITRDSGAPRFRIFRIDSGATVTLNDLMLSGGYTPDGINMGAGEPGGDGGALSNYSNGTFHLTNSTLYNDHADNEGGGIWSKGPAR